MATNKKKKKYNSFTDYTKNVLDLSDDDISPVVDKANPKTYNQTTNAFATMGDISPIKASAGNSLLKGWLKKSEGNKQDAVLGTVSDAILQATTGIAGMGETLVDTFAFLGTGANLNQQLNVKGYLTPEDWENQEKLQKKTAEFIKKDLYNEKEVASKILSGIGQGLSNYSTDPNKVTTMADYERARQTGKDMKKYLNEDAERYSVLDEKSQGLFQSAGQLGATALLSMAGVPWYLTTGVTSFGGEAENALKEGATLGEAGLSGLISAGAEVLTEKLSGGISFGGKTLDDGLTNILAKNISNKGIRALSKVGMDFAGEGTEEVVSQFFSRLGSALYKEENLGEILASEEAFDEYLTSYISGGILGGVSSTGKAARSATTGTDVLTGYSKNEQAVFDEVVKNRIQEKEKADNKKLSSSEKSKIYEQAKKDFEQGNIDIDTIESVLGGETLNKYKSIEEQEASLTKKLQELENAPNTVGNSKKYDSIQNQLNELQSKNEKAQLKEQLSKEVFDMTLNDSRIQESYNQRAKKGQNYTADISKYTPKAQETIKRAIDSGILNDTRKTHEFVDLVAKLSAEKGVSFDFLNNQKLKETGFVLEGKTINGFKNGNTISINMESHNALNTVVGHEITHVLEGSPELYNAMAESVKDFGEAKGIYQEMYDTAFENYKNVYKDMSEEEYKKAIEKEVTADLVAEYIFSDIDFVRGLSTKNRNVFQKVYDEIKYFLKTVTTGSDAEKKLLKAKKMFEEVYRESGKASETSDTTVKEDGHEDGDVNVQYSVQVEDQDTIDFLENQEHIVTYKAMQLIDGKLYPPMAAKVKGENGRYQLTNPSELGKWQQATEDPKNIKKFKNGVGYYTLNKGDGTSVDAAYNPYEHSSNLVLNDQFESAHRRTNLVTVEGVIPTSEMSSGYKAEYAKDSTGVMDWHSGVVAGKLKDNKRQVYLSRYFKPVRIMEDSEVAAKYKEILDGQGVSVPFNVVSPSLLSELEKAGVDIDYNGSPMYQHYAKKAAEKKGVKYSLTDNEGQQLTKEQQEYFKDSKVRDENGNLKVAYHSSDRFGFTVFNSKMSDDKRSHFFTDIEGMAHTYVKDKDNTYKVYLNLKNPLIVDARGRNWNRIKYGETKDELIYKVEKYLEYAQRFDESIDMTDLADSLDGSIIGATEYLLTEAEVDDDPLAMPLYSKSEKAELMQLAEEIDEAYENWDESEHIDEDEEEISFKRYIKENQLKTYNTRKLSEKAQKEGYDGVIINNVRDNGKYTEGKHYMGSVYIAFDSNQIKSVTNQNPTSDEDIRYSLSADSNGNELSDAQKQYFADSKVKDENGNLKVMYHGSQESFTVFDKKKAKSSGLYGKGFYFTESKSHAQQYGSQYEVYLNITNPVQNGTNNITKEQLRNFVEALADNEDYGIENYGYGATVDSITDDVYGKDDFAMLMDLNVTCVGNMVEAIEIFNEVNGTDYNGIIAPTETVAFYPNQIKKIDNHTPTENPDIRYSISDDARQIDNEYLKAVDSGDTETAQKMVDEVAKANGYDTVVFHGTNAEKINVFVGSPDRMETNSPNLIKGYFSDQEAYANDYGENTFKYYINSDDFLYIDAMFDSDEMTEYLKKHGVTGVEYNDFISDEDAVADWLDMYGDVIDPWMFFNENGGNITERIREAGYKGVYWSEGYITEGDGMAYMPFESSLIKSADAVTYDDKGNVIPLSKRFDVGNNDIRFSISDSVETGKELVAVHNLSPEKLLKTMKLGAFPMPSIAVTKASIGHGNFGSISLVFGKDTIDPKFFRSNKVYSGDAWTPTYPSVSYKLNEKVQRNIQKKIDSLVPYNVQSQLGGLHLDSDNMSDKLQRSSGDMVNAYSRDNAMKYAYLVDTNKAPELPSKEGRLDKSGNYDNETVIRVANNYGFEKLTEFAQQGFYDNESLISEIREIANQSFMEQFAPGEKEPILTEDNFDFSDADRLIRSARIYLRDGITSEIDRSKARKLIDESVDQAEYEAWLNDLFSGIVEKTGIRNNKDMFTPSGNRRKWESLHYEETLENVIRAMKEEGTKGIGMGNGNIFGASTTEFSSIDDIRAAGKNITKLSQEEHDKIKDEFQNRFFELAKSIPKNNSWTALDDATNMLVEAVTKYSTRNGIANYLKRESQGWANYSDSVTDELISLVQDIRNMPTSYFEAKPQRAVGFDEVEAVLVPSDIDSKLRQELVDRGLNIVEYEAGNETDRANKLNELDDLKFSISGRNKGAVKNYSGFYSEDVLLDKGTTDDIATASQDIAPVAAGDNVDTNKIAQNDFAEDYAPLTESEANMRDDRQIEDHYFPDDTPVDTGDTEEIYNGTYADHMKPADPFYEKDIFEVGRDRKQKAYMYENPEVKPFFQEEARYMLGELDNSSKGERFYNDQLYYDTNGEYGIFGTKRHTSEEIAYLLDTFNYTYKDIAKGLNAIIEDNGKENNAISKRIEFLLDERLRLGYKDFWFGDRVPPNQEYINLLNEKQINEYNDEAFSNWVQNLSEDDIRYFTQREEIIASDPSEYAPEDIAPQTPEEILYSLEESQDAKLEEMDKKVDAVEEEDTPELSVDEQYSASVENYRTSIEGYNNSRAEIEKAFDDVIAKKQAEYDGLKRKDTLRASNLLMQMENLRLRKANNLSKFDSRIERTQKRLDKMIAEEDAVKERMYGKRRKEAHEGIVNNIKSYFASKGFDLDTVLGKAKNLSTFSTVDNTPQRVMEKSLGYKEGQALADMTVNKVAQNESEGVRWVNGIVKELKKISKEYGIKPRSKESAAAQKFAEGYYVDENDQVRPYKEEQLKAEFPDVRKRENIKKLASDPRIRRIYDDALDSINESRRKNHYKEVPKRANYFLHSMEKSDIFSRLGTPFNPQDIGAADLPTDINGMTADFKPGQPYFASANARKGYKTTYDLLGGVEKYVNNAKNQIYHIEDIQTLRALRNYIADMYGQAKGFEGLDEMSNVEVSERIEQIQSNHLSSFAKFLNEEANIIAGKTSLIDRGLEGIIGRRGIKVVDTINRQVGSNMVGFNVSSALTNVVSGVQAMAKSNKFDVLKAFTQTVSNRIGSIYGKTDGFTESNPGYVRRQGIDRFSSRPVDKVNDAGYFLMGAVDQVTSEFILRTKYNELTRKGMSSEQAHIEADKWASRILGDRSIGQQPQLYNSKMLGLITKFQLEVRNQLDSQFYDTFQDAKTTSDNHLKTAAKVGKTVFELAVLQHIFGTAFESVTGYNPAFDLIEVLMTAIGADDDEESEDTTLDNIEQGFLALLEDLPYTSTLTGGRIPIESALPIKELITGENDYGQEVSRAETLKEVAPYYVLPTGYGQIKKTSQGLGMFDEDLPVSGSYTDSGNLRFPVEDTTKNRVAAGLFGQYANENARDYFDNERDALKEKQIQEYKDLELPIRDYWDYREGLKKQDKLEDKFEYVNDQNVSVEQKNIMINNIVDRKEKVDMSNYDDFANYEEFDWYTKNTEKYNFLQENGVSYKEYKADKDKKEQYDSDYSIYKNNPEEVTMSKAVAGNFLEYRSYMRDLYEIRADKDSSGNSISGTAKAKKQAYIEELELDYGQKLILHRSLYDSKKDKAAYDRQIVEYLNSRDDISQEEMETILKELDIW